LLKSTKSIQSDDRSHVVACVQQVFHQSFDFVHNLEAFLLIKYYTGGL